MKNQCTNKSLTSDAATPCVRVTLPISENKLDLKTALFKGMWYAKEARIAGGKSRCLRSLDSIVIEHTGLTRENSKQMIDRLTWDKSAVTLKVNVEERDIPEFDLETSGIVHGEFAWQLLDKHFLFALPHYAIVVSLQTLDSGRPVFAAKLYPGVNRSLVWKRAVKANIAHYTCGVYWSEEDVLEIYGFSLGTLLEGAAELTPPPFRL